MATNANEVVSTTYIKTNTTDQKSDSEQKTIKEFSSKILDQILIGKIPSKVTLEKGPFQNNPNFMKGDNAVHYAIRTCLGFLMVQALVKYDKDLLKMANAAGETPLMLARKDQAHDFIGEKMEHEQILFFLEQECSEKNLLQKVSGLIFGQPEFQSQYVFSPATLGNLFCPNYLSEKFQTAAKALSENAASLNSDLPDSQSLTAPSTQGSNHSSTSNPAILIQQHSQAALSSNSIGVLSSPSESKTSSHKRSHSAS